MRVGIVAAEPSGDQLGARLMAGLRERDPALRFEGIGGPRMTDAGLDSWYPMEKLSVMGLVEVLGHLPELLALRRRLVARWRHDPPDLFIGVDAPDFNLDLETALKKKGVPTVHYVSPTVWAWREGRVKKLRRAADLVLCIFPFEPDFLARHGVHAVHVGHPLAHRYPLEPDRPAACRTLGLDPEAPVMALLPGSRMGEVNRIAPPFLGAARRLAKRMPGLRILTPVATRRTGERFRSLVEEWTPELSLEMFRDRTAEVLTAADVALVASGTATLEALLCKTPMVVGYRLHPLTYHLITGLGLLKTRQVAMANLLSGEPLAPELLQGRCKPEPLAAALESLFTDRARRRHIARLYGNVHRRLRIDSGGLAADAVLKLLEAGR